MENYEILKLADTLKREMGVSCEVEIVTKSKGRIGKLLSEEKNIGVKMEKSILYIFKEKMTSEEKCIFLVSQQLCRKWIVPKSKKVHILLESIINKKYSNLFKEDKNFTKLLYNLISTGWILSYSVISKSLKLKYVNYLRKIYDPTKLEDVDNAKDRKLLNPWETFYRLQILMSELYLGEPLNSINILHNTHREKLLKIKDVSLKMSRYFWEDYNTSLSLFSDLYQEFYMKGHLDDEKEIKDKEVITYFEAEVFYDRCKKKGLSDKAIKDYFDRIRTIKNINIIGISENNNTLKKIVGV